MSYRQIVGVITVALVVLFIIQNMAIVEIQFLFWSMTLPRSIILLSIFTIGVLIGWLWHAHKCHEEEGKAPDHKA